MLKLYSENLRDLPFREELGILNAMCSRELGKEQKLLDRIVEYKDCIVLYAMCSGLGGGAFEPHASTPEQTKYALQYLLDRGFASNQLVLGLSPIFVNVTGLKKVEKILSLFKDTGICRVFFKPMFLDVEITERFKKYYGKVPVIEDNKRKSCENIESVLDNFGYYVYETSLKESKYYKPLIDWKDLAALGITDTGFPGEKLPFYTVHETKTCDADCIYCTTGECL